MGILLGDVYYYLLGDRTYYEPLDRREPNSADFIEPIMRLLPRGWSARRHGIWFHCTPPEPNIPAHGWKIHLSSTVALAPAVLMTAARLLVREAVPFKFAVDKYTLLCLNRKRWARGGAGKFITIYPSDELHCRHLLETLYPHYIGWEGPYILSDRRYRDSQVLHYRYGGLRPVRRLTVEGRQEPIMELSDGSVVSDERRPYFTLPEGVSDPFCEPSDTDADEQPAGSLRQGRYRIESAIAFSNAGGVYKAHDQLTGRTVLIKEARPRAGEDAEGRDAVYLLRKEFRLLHLLADTGVAPQPVDFFKDWEHYYLVEEYLDGRSFRAHTTGMSLALRTRPSREDRERFFAEYRRLFVLIARALQKLHDRGVVFTDVSYNNIMVLNGGEEVRFVDFEGAYEVGIDPAPYLFTPGFASRQAAAGGGALPADDRFGLGAVMLSGLFPISDLLTLDPTSYDRFLTAFARDLGVPESIEECIRGLLSAEREDRPELPRVIELVERGTPSRDAVIGSTELDEVDIPSLVRQCTNFILESADYEREDRLFPAAPAVFETNGLNIAYGATGVAVALNRILGTVDDRIIDWILKRPIRHSAVPPGLYVGAAGIAWALLELGLRDRAEALMRHYEDHPLKWSSPDLFFGAAGWGLTNLKFFLATQDEHYLRQAIEVGDFLLRTRLEADGNAYWLTNGIEHSGLGHGGSGIALFLLYLFLATGNEEYLDVGRRGLARVLANGVPNPDGGKTWRINEEHVTRTPYWRWGSAGIGITLLRYQSLLDLPEYAEALEALHLDTDRKYAIFPGLHMGLAGIAEFYTDWARFGGGQRAIDAARKVLSGSLLFRLERESGTAFPGENRMRISCDFGTGTAGIAFALHRFHTLGEPAFMVDELLPGKAQPLGIRREQGVAVEAAPVAAIPVLV